MAPGSTRLLADRLVLAKEPYAYGDRSGEVTRSFFLFRIASKPSRFQAVSSEFPCRTEEKTPAPSAYENPSRFRARNEQAAPGRSGPRPAASCSPDKCQPKQLKKLPFAFTSPMYLKHRPFRHQRINKCVRLQERGKQTAPNSERIRGSRAGPGPVSGFLCHLVPVETVLTPSSARA